MPATLKLLFDTVLLCTHRPVAPAAYTTDAKAMKHAAIAAAEAAKLTKVWSETQS